MAKRGKTSHLLAPTAEAGLEMYLSHCSDSGLPNVKRIAKSYKSMPKAKRLAKYVEKFGADAAWGDGEPENGAQDAISALEAQIAALRAGLQGEEGTVATEENTDFVRGASFAYTNRNGDTTEHEIERVKGGKAITDQGQTFKISTLVTLAEKGTVELV